MILPNGMLSFQIMAGKQDTKKYIDIIIKFSQPIIKLKIKPGFIFQQDNASIHCSKKAKQFFRNSQVTLLNWPRYSPDINIIENVWHVMSQILFTHKDFKYF